MMADSHTCIALAYGWEMAPHGEEAFDVLLAMASVTADTEEGDPEAVAAKWEPAVRDALRASFALQYPPRPPEANDADVSGVLGLLGVMHGDQGRQRAAAFERLVADSAIRLLVRALGELPEGASPLILLQGPMLPKLRGRLYYRGLDPDLPILCLTYQPEWLCRIPETSQGPRGAGRVSANLVWEGPLPPLTIDRGSRSFVGSRGATVSYHVEVPANNWDPSEGTQWWDRRRELCARVCGEPLAVPQERRDDAGLPAGAEIPWPLGAASAAAREQLDHTLDGERAIAEFTMWSLEQAQTGPAPAASSPRLSRLRDAYEEVWGRPLALAKAARPGSSGPPPTRDPGQIREKCLEAFAKHGPKCRLWALAESP